MRLLLNARNRTVAIDGSRIVEPGGAFDAVIDLPDADIRPGLINAHEHLHRNHYGRLGEPPYRNAAQWAAHIQDRYRRRIASRHRWPRRNALLAGAWKNLFAGVTTVVHHDRWEAEFERGFPLRVAAVQSADSVDHATKVERDVLYCIHVGEGVDHAAADEIRLLDAQGLLTSKLIAVHGVGIDEDGVERLRAAGAALVWCPTSNLFLLGQTAPEVLLNSGIDVLLGSDSLLSGQGDLLDELRAARAHGGLDGCRLEAAVGSAAARRLGLPAPSLQPGAAADLIAVRKPILEACAEDVVLVIVDGTPRVILPELTPSFGRIADHGATMRVHGVTRWASPHLGPLSLGDDDD